MTEKYIFFLYLMFKPGKIYDYKSVSFSEKEESECEAKKGRKNL